MHANLDDLQAVHVGAKRALLRFKVATTPFQKVTLSVD